MFGHVAQLVRAASRHGVGHRFESGYVHSDLDIHYGWVYRGGNYHQCKMTLTKWGAHRVLKRELRKERDS